MSDNKGHDNSDHAKAMQDISAQQEQHKKNMVERDQQIKQKLEDWGYIYERDEGSVPVESIIVYSPAEIKAVRPGNIEALKYGIPEMQTTPIGTLIFNDKGHPVAKIENYGGVRTDKHTTFVRELNQDEMNCPVVEIESLDIYGPQKITLPDGRNIFTDGTECRWWTKGADKETSEPTET